MPKTKCVWTGGHCCEDKQFWNSVEEICETKTAGELCFSFWPSNKVEGKGVKYTETPKKVCWNIGSVAYGFWVPVGAY